MDVYHKLGGVLLKNPTSFKNSKYNLTKSGRVASGKMRMDIIAVKRKFELEYAVIPGDLYDLIDSILFSGNSFFSYEYVENGMVKTATVYAGQLEGQRYRTDGCWYWKGVKFDLIEQ